MLAAEQVLTAVYKARAAIGMVRGPWMPAGELQEAEGKLATEHGEDFQPKADDRHKRLITTQVIMSRINESKAAWDEVYESMAVAFALLDKSVEASLESLMRQVRTVRVAAEGYADVSDKDDRDFAIKTRRTIWAFSSGEDEVGAAVDKAVADIEASVRPLLQSDTAAA